MVCDIESSKWREQIMKTYQFHHIAAFWMYRFDLEIAKRDFGKACVCYDNAIRYGVFACEVK